MKNSKKIVAIALALITKEVYSSLFIGILSGALLYSNFSFTGTIDHMFTGGFIPSIADSYNIGIILFLVVLGATEKPENSSIAGLVIGLSLTLVHIIGIGFTGTSVNPARSLGPAIFAGGTALSTVWVFFAGPLAGAVIAALVYRGIIKTKY